tara:strand:+ start:131 stop:373 length:243 start_codon:yes stop_codon:yes gene_type:complete
MAEKAYCVKCRSKRNMEGGKRVTMKNGRHAMKGKCNKCSTKMFKITGGAGNGTAKSTGGKSRRRRTNKRKSRKNITRNRR